MAGNKASLVRGVSLGCKSEDTSCCGERVFRLGGGSSSCAEMLIKKTSGFWGEEIYMGCHH